ncbi:hypothetical protein ZHAS_00000151 [Anopheles sinensis]|uniref:Uncharacterized protein n=1 Tax=Anopheles sinensis TaxID=74873 RepID=A0A084V9W8_ANOSI|nr:hypothetical protein ZHAS_00000151 [Anopheles sinensis]
MVPGRPTGLPYPRLYSPSTGKTSHEDSHTQWSYASTFWSCQYTAVFCLVFRLRSNRCWEPLPDRDDPDEQQQQYGGHSVRRQRYWNGHLVLWSARDSHSWLTLMVDASRRDRESGTIKGR